MDAHGTDSQQEAHSQAMTPIEQDGVKRFHAAVAAFQDYRDTAATSSVGQDTTDLVLPVSVTRRSAKLAAIYDGTSPCSSWGPKLSKLQGVLLLHDLMDACLPVQHLSEFEAAIMRKGSPVPSQVDADSGEAFAAGVRDLEPLQASSALLLRMYHLTELEAARVLSARAPTNNQTVRHVHSQALCGLLRAALRGDVCSMQWYQSREGMPALLEEAPVRELLQRMQDLSRLLNEQQCQLAASQLLQPEGGMLQGCLLASNSLGSVFLAFMLTACDAVCAAALVPQLRMDVTAAQSLLVLTVTRGEVDTVLQVLDTKLVAGVQYPPVSYDSLKAALACGCPRDMLCLLLRKGLVRGQHTLSAGELGHLVWDTAPSRKASGYDGSALLRLIKGCPVSIPSPDQLVAKAAQAAAAGECDIRNSYLVDLLQLVLPTYDTLPCTSDSGWVYLMCFLLSDSCKSSTRDAVLRMLSPVPGFEGLFREAQTQLLPHMITRRSRGSFVWHTSTVHHPKLAGLWSAEHLFYTLPEYLGQLRTLLRVTQDNQEFESQTTGAHSMEKRRKKNVISMCSDSFKVGDLRVHNLLKFIVQSHAVSADHGHDQWRIAWASTLQAVLPLVPSGPRWISNHAKYKFVFHAQILHSLNSSPFKDLLLWLWSGQASERAWQALQEMSFDIFIKTSHVCRESSLSPDTVAELLDTGVQHLPEATLAKRLTEVDTLFRADMALPCIITHFMRACEDGKAVLASGMLQYIACHCSVETLYYLVSERLHVSLAHVQAQELQVNTVCVDPGYELEPSCGCKSFAEICAEAADFVQKRPVGTPTQYPAGKLRVTMEAWYEMCDGIPSRRVQVLPERVPLNDSQVFEWSRMASGNNTNPALAALWHEWRSFFCMGCFRRRRPMSAECFISDWAVRMTAYAYVKADSSQGAAVGEWGLPAHSLRSYLPPPIPPRTLAEGQSLLQAWIDIYDDLIAFETACEIGERKVKTRAALIVALETLVFAACFRATHADPEHHTECSERNKTCEGGTAGDTHPAVTEVICQDAALRIFFAANWSSQTELLQLATRAALSTLAQSAAHPSCAIALERLYTGCITATLTLDLHAGPPIDGQAPVEPPAQAQAPVGESLTCSGARQVFEDAVELNRRWGRVDATREWMALIYRPEPDRTARESYFDRQAQDHIFRLLTPIQCALAWCFGLQPDWIQLQELHLHCIASCGFRDQIDLHVGYRRNCFECARLLLQVLCMFVQDVLLPPGHPSASVAAAVVKQWYLHGTSRLPGVHEGIMRWLVNGLVRACRWGGGIARPQETIADNFSPCSLKRVLFENGSSSTVSFGSDETEEAVMPTCLPRTRARHCAELHRGRRHMLLNRTARRKQRKALIALQKRSTRDRAVG